MTGEETIAAAIRNRANRMAQLGRLASVVVQARERVGELAMAKNEVRERCAGFQQMQELRWVPGFYPTPPKIIEVMLEHAELETGMRVLEPSAGKGDLAKAAHAKGCSVVCVEKVSRLAAIVRGMGFPCECTDFMDYSQISSFDRVLMNPPFEKHQDQKHIEYALKFLRPGGKLIAVASSTTMSRLTGWADENGGYTVPLPAGSFKNSDRSTGVNTGLIIAVGKNSR